MAQDYIFQGEPLKVSYTIMDQSVEPAVAADLTGLTLIAYLGWKHEPKIVTLTEGNGITITSAPDGEVDVELTSAQTELAPRAYTLELWGDDGAVHEVFDRFVFELRDSWRV